MMIKTKKIFVSKNFIGCLILTLLFTIFIDPIFPTLAQAQQVCATALKDAETKYNDGQFDEAIELLKKCIAQGFTEEQQKEAYRLLGLAYLAKNFRDQAREAIKNLLTLVPNWQPDPIQDPPPFTRLVEEIKQKMREQQEKEKAEEHVEKKPVIPEPPREEPIETIQTPQKGRSKKLLWVGIGAAVIGGGLIAVLAGSGSNAGPPPPAKLPDPPGAPGGN
jgi:hypothetical protein